jgi:hypothetical protein
MLMRAPMDLAKQTSAGGRCNCTNIVQNDDYCPFSAEA